MHKIDIRQQARHFQRWFSVLFVFVICLMTAFDLRMASAAHMAQQLHVHLARQSVFVDAVETAISRDGKLLAASTHEEVVVWDLAANEEYARFDWPQTSKLAGKLAFSPNGRYLAAGTSQLEFHPTTEAKVSVWDLKTKQEVYSTDKLTGGVAFTPNNKWLITCTATKIDRAFIVVELATKTIRRLGPGSVDVIDNRRDVCQDNFAISPKEFKIATTGQLTFYGGSIPKRMYFTQDNVFGEDFSVYISNDGTLAAHIHGHVGVMRVKVCRTATAFSPLQEPRCIGKYSVFNRAGYRPELGFGTVSLSPDDKYVLIGSFDGLEIFDLQTANRVLMLKAEDFGVAPPRKVNPDAYMLDSTTLIVVVNGQVQTWKIDGLS